MRTPSILARALLSLYRSDELRGGFHHPSLNIYKVVKSNSHRLLNGKLVSANWQRLGEKLLVQENSTRYIFLVSH
jgi:hypothetical protein